MLGYEVTQLRQTIKHAPGLVDLYDARSLLGRVEDALVVLDSLVIGADISTHYNSEHDTWSIAISAEVGDRRPLFDYIANGG